MIAFCKRYLLNTGLLGLAMVLCMSVSVHAAPDMNADYRLKVSFDPAHARVTGRATIRLDRPQAVSFELDDALRISALRVDGKARSVAGISGSKRLNLAQAKKVEINYSATFNDSFDHGIFPGTVVLTDQWFPVLRKMWATYRLEADLPKGYQAVSEGDEQQVRNLKDRTVFEFRTGRPLPSDEGIAFMASNRYQLREEQVGDVLLRTLLTSEMAASADNLLQEAKRLLARYQGLFGPLPFKRLTLAEAPTSSSLSYPGYLLLNRANIRKLPEDTTLGHELVHEWFGNGVFISWDSGNWAEGAAIYFADHDLQEDSGKDWLCRRRILQGYHDRAAGKEEFPLTKFHSREDALSRWIGYGKGGMVYHALQQELGGEQFKAGIRDFVQRNQGRIASFSDLQQSFERVAGRPLDWFFKQWVAGTGLPLLSGQATTRQLADGRFNVTIQLQQDTGHAPFRLTVPVTIMTDNGEETLQIRMDGPTATAQAVSGAVPKRVAIDPDYHLLRQMPAEEQLPTIGRLESEKDLIIMVAESQDDRYTPLLEAFNQRGTLVKTREPGLEFPRRRVRSVDQRRRSGRSDADEGRMDGIGIPNRELAGHSLAVMGRSHPVLSRLFGAALPSLPPQPQEGFSLAVVKHPLDQGRVVAIFDSSNRRETFISFDRLENYGGYSAVSFANGHLQHKKIFEQLRGITLPLRTE